jgi:hypothetical protein
MPRRAQSTSIDALVRASMADVVRRAAQDIARAIAELAAGELSERLETSVSRPGRGGRRRGAGRRSARRQMTRWVADRRARRVPTFVIEMTGLKTKKQVVAKFGRDAAFQKGKAAPKPKS